MQDQTTPPTPDHIPLPPKKRPSAGRLLLLGCGGTIALFIIMTAAYYIFVPKEERDKATARREAERMEARRNDSLKVIAEQREDSLRDADAARHGIRISRDSIERYLSLHDVEIDFDRGKPINGLDNYMARTSTTSNTLLQVIGPSDNPSSASIIGMFDEGPTASTAISRETTRVMETFANAVDADAASFLRAFTHAIVKRRDRNQQKTIDHRTIKLSYFHIQEVGTMTLTIEPSP